MTDTIDTTKLREQLANIDAPLKYDTCSASPASWFCDKGVRYEEHGGPLIEGDPDACRTIVAAINSLHSILDRLDAQAEELAALRRNRATWEASGQDAEKRIRYAEARVLLLEAEIARLGKEIERRDQSLAIRRKICRELVGLVRPLKARVSELEMLAAAARAYMSIRHPNGDLATTTTWAQDMDKAAVRLMDALTHTRPKAPPQSLPESRGTTSGELLQLYDREENQAAYAVADSEGGEA